LLDADGEQAVEPAEAIKLVELKSFFSFLLPHSGHETGSLSVANTIAILINMFRLGMNFL
jgi:hypothetical protein